MKNGLLVVVGLGLGNFAYQFIAGGNYAEAIDHTWFEATGIITYCILNKIWKQ